MATQPSLLAVQITISITHFIAIGVTSFRLWRRFKTRAFWWDDRWAGLSLLLNLAYLGFALYVSKAGSTGSKDSPEAYDARIVTFWFSTMLFTTSLWGARMSMLVSISRLIPPSFPLRRINFCFGIFFVMMWLGLITQKIYTCTFDPSWHHSRYMQCTTKFNKLVSIVELCTDVVADVILVAVPLHMLWPIKLPRHQRPLVLILFTSSVWITLASIVHSIFFLKNNGAIQTLAAHLEVAVSLIVCNLLVVIPYVHRAWFGGKDMGDTFDSSITIPSNIMTVPTSSSGMPSSPLCPTQMIMTEATQLSSV